MDLLEQPRLFPKETDTVYTPVRSLVLLLPFTMALSTPLLAQAPAAPPPPFTTTVSAGLALTSGNKDTSTVNLGYELAYDPKTRNIVKSDGLFLRGKTEGELSADRLGFNARDEYKVIDGGFVFGEMRYLQDQFKNIDYLFAPTGGVGYRFADTARTRLSADVGVGGVWEKKPLLDVETSGAVTLGEKLTHQLSTTASLSQTFSALYKTSNFSDALYTVGASISATVVGRTLLKVEVLDSYKNLVDPTFVKNDVALIASVAFKR